jgi:glycosyltransferase involved in cell wall biosynthesis
MRLVDLCPYGVYPPRSGGQRLVHHTSLSLGARHQVFVFAMGLRRFEGARLRSFVQHPHDRYVEYRHVTPLTYLSYLRRRRTGLPPLRASAVLRWTAPRPLRQALGAADVVQVEGPWQFAFARDAVPGTPIVLVVQNAETGLLEDRRLSPRLVRLAARIERSAIARADAVIFLSVEDRNALTAAYQLEPGRWYISPPGVDLENFRPVSHAERETAKTALGLSGPVALFAGSWHPPNRSALAALHRLAPETSGWTFLVVGSVGNPRESEANVRVTGPLDDVLPYFRAADVALNPMTEGSGVNLKVLEYLAMGLPTVSTAFGIRGLDVADVVDVVTLADVPNALTGLAAPGARMTRSRAARAAAEARFGWERVARTRERIYAEILGNRAAPPA